MLTGPSDEKVVTALGASGASKTLHENPAFEVPAEVSFDRCWEGRVDGCRSRIRVKWRNASARCDRAGYVRARNGDRRPREQRHRRQTWGYGSGAIERLVIEFADGPLGRAIGYVVEAYGRVRRRLTPDSSPDAGDESGVSNSHGLGQSWNVEMAIALLFDHHSTG